MKRFEYLNMHGETSSGTVADLKKLAERGEVDRKTPVRLEGEEAWVDASELEGVFPEDAAEDPEFDLGTVRNAEEEEEREESSVVVVLSDEDSDPPFFDSPDDSQSLIINPPEPPRPPPYSESSPKSDQSKGGRSPESEAVWLALNKGWRFIGQVAAVGVVFSALLCLLGAGLLIEWFSQGRPRLEPWLVFVSIFAVGAISTVFWLFVGQVCRTCGHYCSDKATGMD